MTKEELEKDYYADRPTEPYSDDDCPNDWANIAHYAEENLEKAFKRISELEAIARNTKATDESFALLTLQLIEAKKIIRSLLTCCRNYPQENAEKMRQAEKFIKDSEVVK